MSSNPKGLFCPECRGQRLVTTTTRRVCAGVTIRYRRCSACGFRIVTEEKLAKGRSANNNRTTP
jgi:DNA-directed RNA polymerase subunit RPC12/RpoP